MLASAARSAEAPGEFRELETAVLGLSVDSHYANEAFAKSLGLEFPLLADFKRQAMTAYGVLNADAGYSGRAVFAIDKDGHLIYKDVAANAGDMAQIPSPERALERAARARQGLS